MTVEVVKLLTVFAVGVVIPLLSIALVIMFPARGRRTSSGEDSAPLGLGEVSLQDEFWEFINDVERGRVAPDEVAAAAIAVAERRGRTGAGGADGADGATAAA